MKFVIVGAPRAGKSTFGKMLAEILGTEAKDTSELLVELETTRQRVIRDRYQMASVLEDLYDPDKLTTSWDENRNRPSREYLVALGDAVCETLGQDFLGHRILQECDVCVGVRRQKELNALRERYGRDLAVIYVQRDVDHIVDNHEIPHTMCEFVINNNGSLEDLKKKAEAVTQGKLEVLSEDFKSEPS